MRQVYLSSGKDFVHDIAVNVSQAIGSTTARVGKPSMVQTQQM